VFNALQDARMIGKTSGIDNNPFKMNSASSEGINDE